MEPREQGDGKELFSAFSPEPVSDYSTYKIIPDGSENYSQRRGAWMSCR